MKISFHILIVLSMHLLNIAASTAIGQSTLLYSPGPANFDSSRFAHVYFLRDLPDSFENNWLGVIVNNNNGMCVKADMNRIYRVNTTLTGPTQFHTHIQDNVERITIDLEPGKNYYVQLKPIRRPNQTIAGEMTLLETRVAMDRMNNYPHAIQDRYCIIPFTPAVDFIDNAFNDTASWYADKTHQYYFRMLAGWDFVMRSTLRTIYGFRNDLISETFSEAGGLLYLPLSKCKSESAFDKYCNDKFIPGILEHRGDSIIQSSVEAIAAPPGIDYARLVTIENITWQAKQQKGNPLVVRSAYVVFYWVNERGKGFSACLFESERGTSVELHSLASIQERVQWCWSTFQLSNWQ